MIFHALISLYERLDKTGKMPSLGFSDEDIGFVVNINRDGRLLGQPQDLRHKIKANSYEFRTSTVPYSNKVGVRSGNAATMPNFMVDKADYVFGMSGAKTKEKYRKNFAKRIDEVCGESDDMGVVAVKRFLANWQPAESTSLEGWEEISGNHGKWVAFRLEGDQVFVHERPAVKELWAKFVSDEDYPEGISLLDGGSHKLQHQYSQFKFGTGASLASFNIATFESYRKSRGDNAPISVEGEFQSSAALKYLLRSKTQRLRVGDATTVFWAERKSPIEEIFGQIINPAQSDEGTAKPVAVFLEAVRKGYLPRDLQEDDGLKFYILGLAVAKSRLAVRFWHICEVGDLARRLQEHFASLEMVRSSEKDIANPGVWHLLKETARETKDISPVLGGALVRSILTGQNYPQGLYHGVLSRIRVGGPINHLKASILKAVLVRNHNMEVPMSLDTERKEIAYLLGRLFAVLERAQLDALGKVNSTIKDRFFSAASATPASVFPRLLRLSQHHIETADYGFRSDRRIGDIMENIDDFPAHMNLQDQGQFAIGYYQQKNAIFGEISEAANKKKLNKDQGEE